MNYDHLYHAGNHADVLKHLVLLAFIHALSQKPTPWCYLDTHAGRGIYDLSLLKNQVAPEYAQGIQLLTAATSDKPALCDEYLSWVQKVNPQGGLRYYPGSTYFVRQLARAKDRLIACELHYSTYDALKKFFAHDKQVAVHHVDGYNGLKAFTPPKEKRGLVLIDPPYEEVGDWRAIITALTQAVSHWQSGHYLIWYPLKDKAHVMGWLRKIRANIKNEILITELCPNEVVGDSLYGSGMVIINPYWKFNDQFEPVLAWLWNALSINKKGYFRITSLDSVVK